MVGSPLTICWNSEWRRWPRRFLLIHGDGDIHYVTICSGLHGYENRRFHVLTYFGGYPVHSLP